MIGGGGIVSPLVLLCTVAACSSLRPAAAGTQSGDSTTSAPPATPSEWVLTPQAFGRVRIGWTVNELNAALGDSLRPTYRVSDECDQLVPAAFPRGASLMVLRDTVVRIDVDSAGIPTPEGVGVGDTEARVRRVYESRAVVTPHKYTGPNGHYITVADPSDSTRMTIFETDGTRVTEYRAGRVPGVQFIEGCA